MKNLTITPKKTLIAGYYGFGNIGDEAILSSILSGLRRQHSNIEFIVVSGNPVQTHKQYKVRSVLWTDISAIMDACEESDLILLGGGGLFHDYWGITEDHILTQHHSGISFYSDFPILAKLYNKPCVLYSLGVGPLLTEAGKKITKQSFENATIATVRDVESFNLLQGLGVDTSHIKTTADTVFNLNSDHEASTKIIKSIKKSASPLIAVGLRHWVDENISTDWYKEIASALDTFSEKYNASFLFLPFQISPDNSLTDDLVASQKVTDIMKYSERVTIFQETVTPEIMSGMIGKCDLLVGMRLHSLIFAVKEAVPFVGLIYDPKVQSLINASSMQEYSLSMQEINAEILFSKLEKGWMEKEKTKKMLSEKSKYLKEAAKENIKLVLNQLDTSFTPKEINSELLQKLLLKQTRKLAEAEKTAHSLWLKTQEPKERNVKAAQIPLHKASDFEPTPAQLKSYLPDIICFSIIDWEFRYQRPQQIMSQFAMQGHRVFYISVSRFQAMTEPVQIKFIKENVYEIRLSAQHIPDLYGEAMSDENVSAMINSLKQLTGKFQIKEAIGYVMIASWQKVAFEARHQFGWKIIYDCMDEWDNFPLIKSPIIEAELRLVRDCDLLLVTSQILFDKWSAENRPMLLARNAADYEFYEQYYQPNNLLNINHPIIGYYGAIADWFDLELMIDVAKSRPNHTFILLGGIFDLDVSELVALPNVMLLGQQPYETMPQYLFHFDVCMIPFKINPITEATDPVKIYEYMSAGKPVVSVALPEVMHYKELLYIANSADEFANKIDQALHEDNVELQKQRKIFSQKNSWRNRVLSINDKLQELDETQINTENPFPLVLAKENVVLSKFLFEYTGVNYWLREYKKDNIGYRQVNSEIGQREFQVLSKLQNPYFPKLVSFTNEGEYSVLVYEMVEGVSLESALPTLSSSVNEFYFFVLQCLDLLATLQKEKITHRNIRCDNVFIKDGKLILKDALWAVADGDKEELYPFGIGGSERALDGDFSDVYSVGKILEYVSKKRYPLFDAVIFLMVEPDSKKRLEDIDILKALFQISSDEDNLSSSLEIELLSHILRYANQISSSQRLTNNLYEKVAGVQQENDNFLIQANFDKKQIEVLNFAVFQKDKMLENKETEILAIRNSNTWKVALFLQKISKFFKRGK